MLKAKRAFFALCYFIMNAIGKFLAFAVVKEDDQIWLISERNFDAKDNGFHFFRYMNKEHPEIKTYYVIPKRSDDYDKVAAIGNTVSPGSIKHYFLLYFADALISTHAHGYTPDMVIYSHLARHGMFKPKGVSVFLQHGVLDKDTEWLYRENFKPDMFVVTTKQEQKFVLEKCKQPTDVVELTGLCRYDNLMTDEPAEKAILFMPTWRAWLQDASKDDFVNSMYFRKITSLLNCSTLNDELRKAGYELWFYPHIEMQKYMSEFTGASRVKILDAKNSDVQDLLKKAEVLITDYSSVYFDFLYMKKPVYFYQWDKQRFTGEHYKGVTAKYEQLGKVTDHKGTLVKMIAEYLHNGSEKKPKDIFRYHDTNNCKRVYEAILKRSRHGQGS